METKNRFEITPENQEKGKALVNWTITALAARHGVTERIISDRLTRDAALAMEYKAELNRIADEWGWGK